MELFLSNNLNSQFLIFLSHYTRLAQSGRVKLVVLSNQAQKLNDDGVIKIPAIPSLITEDAQILTNTFAIAQYLANISYTEQILFGNDNQTLGQILQVFEAQRKLNGLQLVEAFLKHLESRVFLVTNHVTIADFFLYIHTYDAVSVWTDDEKSNKFKQIQALPQVQEINKQFGRYEVKPPSPFVQVVEKGKKQK